MCVPRNQRALRAALQLHFPHFEWVSGGSSVVLCCAPGACRSQLGCGELLLLVLLLARFTVPTILDLARRRHASWHRQRLPHLHLGVTHRHHDMGSRGTWHVTLGTRHGGMVSRGSHLPRVQRGLQEPLLPTCVASSGTPHNGMPPYGYLGRLHVAAAVCSSTSRMAGHVPATLASCTRLQRTRQHPAPLGSHAARHKSLPVMACMLYRMPPAP